MNEVQTLYKLIILYIIEKIKFPLTNGQLCAIFAEERYTDYFTLQQVLVDMVESDLLSTQVIRTSTFYSLTDQGRETLEFFQSKIPSAIRGDIDAYLKKNQYELREENAVIADYAKTNAEEFTATLMVKEKDTELVRIQITVPLESQAIHICDMWQKKNSDIYQYLIKELMQE